MTGRTDFITEASWVDIFTIWYFLVDSAYQRLAHRYGDWRRRGPAPVFSDSEVITVALIIDTFFGGHEALGLSFLRQYHRREFPQLPADGHFNERRTILGPLIDQIRGQISWEEGLVRPDDPLRLIDSAPVHVATYARGGDNQTVAGTEYCGVAKSHGAKVFGFRLVLTTTTEQVADRWMLAPACYHDSTTLAGMTEDAFDQFFLADGAYHSPTLEPILAEKHNVILFAPPRKDSRQPWPKEFRRLVNRLRRGIETAFSILATVFKIEQPGARSLHGLISRISTRLLAYTLCFVMDQYLSQLYSQTQN